MHRSQFTLIHHPILTQKTTPVLLIFLVAISFSSLAQEPSRWRSLPWTQDLTFDQVKAAYEEERDAFATTDSTGTQTSNENEEGEEEEEGIAFRRFEYFWRSRVNNGDPAKRGKLQSYVNSMNAEFGTNPFCTQNLNPSDWQLLGPRFYSDGDSLNHYMGIVVSLWADPAEVPVTHVLAGTNSSGLWRGTLGPEGWEWTCLTENLRMPGMGVASIAVNSNADIYIGCTIGHAGGYTAGVWRSTDNGQGWDNLPDFPPTLFDPGVFDIKFIGDYLYVVQGKRLMRAPRFADHLMGTIFDEILTVPADKPEVHFIEITGFSVPAGDGLILCTYAANGRDGGGRIYRSFDDGDTWVDISDPFAQEEIARQMKPMDGLIGDVDNNDPHKWHKTTPNPPYSDISISPPSGGGGPKRITTFAWSTITIPGLTYRFRLACEKASPAIVRAYLIHAVAANDSINMTGAQQIMEVVDGDHIQYDSTFVADSYYRKIVIEAEFPAGYDPDSLPPGSPVGITLVPIEPWAGGFSVLAAVTRRSIGHANCSVVNSPGNPNNGIYLCVLGGAIFGATTIVYRSTDGLEFTPLFTANDDGGFNKNSGEFEVLDNGTVYLGGVKLYAHAPPNYGSGFINTGHVDIRDLLSLTNNAVSGSLLVGNDGGVAYTANAGAPNPSFQSLNGSNFPITQFYGMGIDEHERLLVAGAQDNNSWTYDPSAQVWTKFDGGDGGRSRSFTSKDGTLKARVYIRNGGTFLNVTNGAGAEICSLSHSNANGTVLGNPAELYADPSTDEVKCFLGHGDLYRMSCNEPQAVNLTASLTAFHDNNNLVWGIGVHELDDNIIFMGGREQKWSDSLAAAPGRLYRTMDGGATWTDIGSNITDVAAAQPFNWMGVTSIAVDPDVPPDGPITVYISFSGSSEGGDKRVYKSTDNGDTWTDISAGLPIFQVNDLAIQKGSGGILYAATDAGVYVYDPQIGSWSCFSQALPICIATEVVVNTCSGKLYASTFGRGIWVTDLYQPDRVAELEVTADAVWSDVRPMANTVRVKDGAKLTITGELRMYPGRSIIVEPGSQLIVDGGTITSTCDQFWPGIQVWGNNAQHQFGLPYAEYQGTLVLKNGAVIENARQAIRAMNPDDPESTGGVVQVTDATFLNCQQGASFSHYKNFQPPSPNLTVHNFSFFHRVRFEVNDDYLGVDDFDAHVTMENVEGITFNECGFFNLQTTDAQHITQSHKLGQGIKSLDAQFTVTGSCAIIQPCCPVCPEEHLTRSTFVGLDHGIQASVSATDRSFIATECVFDNNVVGVYSRGVNSFQVTRSNFRGGNQNVELSGAIDPFLQAHMGIFSTGGHGFRIEENSFTKAENAPNRFAGAWINNSGEHNSQVYKNTAEGTDFAFVGEGQCMDPQNDGSIGLQFLCNGNHNPGGQDILDTKVEIDQTNYDHSIRTQQGSSTMPAENTFTQDIAVLDESDFKNQTEWPLTYWYNTSHSATAEPLDITPDSWVDPIPTASTNGCPSRLELGRGHPISEFGLIGIRSEFSAAKDAYVATAYVYNALLDGGNTDVLIDEVQRTWPADAWQLHDELMGMSPYISPEVLKEVTIKNIMPQAMLLEVLLANPEGTRKGGLIKWLEYEAPDPLPPYMLDLIVASWDQKTFRTQLESEMGQHHADMSLAADELISEWKNDTLSINTDSILSLWQQVPSLGARYSEVLTRLERHEYEAATTLMNGLGNRYKLNDEQVKEREHTLMYIGILTNVHAAGRDLLKLEPAELTALREVAAFGCDRPALWAQNLLCFGYKECHAPCTGPGGVQKAYKRPRAVPEKEPPSPLSIYPNPASSYVTFAYTLNKEAKDAVLVLRSMEGREVKRMPLTARQGQQLLDSRDFAPGTYSVELLNDGMRLATERLVLKP